MDSDIERALQHAIGQANSAFATGVPGTDTSLEISRKKGGKRAREETAKTGELSKEKRRKTKNTDGLDVPTVTVTPVHEIPVPVASQSEIVKSQKKRKAKVPHAQTHSNSTDTATDLLALLGDPSSPSSSPSSNAAPTPAATSLPEDLPTSQIAQDLDYPQTIQSFPHFPSEDQPFSQYSNTNDDILRAFQDLDLTRLAGVLRSLDIPLSPQQSDTQVIDALPADKNASLLDHISANTENASNASAVVRPAQPRGVRGASGFVTAVKKRPTNALKPVAQSNPNLAALGPSIASPEHTHLLANKWLSASKLKELVETEGLIYKKGKFSALEAQALKTAIENYRVNHGLSAEELIDVIFSKSKEENTFWTDITASVPARPITAVYHHVHRVYHPLKHQGKWSGDEDAALLKAVADHGQAWQKISDRVGRTAQDCRDRWKNHLAHSAERQHGHWTKEEEEELTRIVTEITKKSGKESKNDIFWSIVSQRMGNKRGRQQCRIKWTDALSKTVKNFGSTPRWSKQDSFILVQKVISLDVRDDSEIDWNILSDADWNLWSAHSLQRRWRSLKLGIKGHETMTIGEILEILEQRNPLPRETSEMPPNKSPRKERKSAKMIEDDEDDDQAGEKDCGQVL